MTLMEFFASLLPAIAHWGAINYGLVFLVSFAESLAFVGGFIPGGVLIVLAGFLSAQGYLDLGDLIWLVAAAAILGDGLSYWLGSRGTRFFHQENKILKLSYLEKGEKFFKRHGEKSILLGRFVGPLRPVVPFVAGLVRLRLRTFLFWNITSGFLWATSYLLLGYFFGGAVSIIESWATRIGLFVLLALISAAVLGFLFKRSKWFISFLSSIAVLIKNATISPPDL